MRKRTILVTGSGGTVGSYIPSVFSPDTIIMTTRNDLDITNQHAVLRTLHSSKPDIVIHLAAKTNVEACEKDKTHAHAVNALGTQYVAEACATLNAVLVYVSSTAVFDGAKNYFTEKDTPRPINTYGQTKLQGEEAVRKLTKKHFIVRAGWIIGGGQNEKKFLSYIIQQIKEGREEILAVNDKFGTVAYAKELVEYIRNLLAKHSFGTYHFGSSGVCSRYTLAKAVVALLKKGSVIKPVTSSHFIDRFSAPRPKREVLQSVKIPFIRPWKVSLREYIMSEISHV